MKKIVLGVLGLLVGVITFSFLRAHGEKVDEVKKANKRFKFV